MENDIEVVDGRAGTTTRSARNEQTISNFQIPTQAAVAGPARSIAPADDQLTPWLGSFKLFQAQPPIQPAELSWYGRGNTARAGAYSLTDPLVYSARGRPSEEEASCIDLSLPIGELGELETLSLGYYPTYSRMTAQQRATYLQWLASGRCGLLSDIGYVFLYFYGLERRLLLQQEDLSPIVKEVVRLLETYTVSGSFDGYLSRFLAYVLARAGIASLKVKWFEAVFEKTRAQRDEQHLAVGLAWLHTHNRALPANLAIRIARLDPRAPRSVVLNRLPEEFSVLFAKRYRERFGDGLSLKVSKRDKEITYRPASPSLPNFAFAPDTLPPVKVPNVMGIQSQFNPLIELWTGCINELKPLSRVIAKGHEALTRQAFEALPDDLKSGVEHPDKAQWEQLAVDHVREDGVVLVEVGQLATVHGIEKRPKLTAKQSDLLARTAHYVGFMIEPDARVLNRAYHWDEPVALVRPEEVPALPKDARYAGASLMLELGVFVAAADGYVEESEVDHITRFLESQFLLEPADARRLEARKRVLLSCPPSIAGIGNHLRAVLTADQREGVGRFLVGVAAANGSIEKKEVTALRSAYKALDIAPDRLNDLLDEIRRGTEATGGTQRQNLAGRANTELHRAALEPVEVYRPDAPALPGEAIAPRPTPEQSFTLNEDMLKKILADTERVVALIGKAMGEAEPEETAGLTKLELAPRRDDPRFAGLKSRFHAALVELLAQPSWPTPAFEELVRRHTLMRSETMDVVNEWALERFDDLILVEAGDCLTVQTHLITEQS